MDAEEDTNEVWDSTAVDGVLATLPWDGVTKEVNFL